MRPEELRPAQERRALDLDQLDELVEREFAVIGQRTVRVDGLDKAMGRAVYADDMSLPGMLHGKILRSPHAHARILSIDTAEAEAMDGVYAVITGADMPEKYCIIPWTRDEQALATERVRYIGDAVAAVAAVDEDTAIRAADAIRVLYEPLPAYLDPREALRPGDDAVPIHEPLKDGWNGNITKKLTLEFGPVDAHMAGSEVVIEGDYYYEGSTHAPIEPHCAIGYADPAGKLTVWSSTQVPHYLHRELARVLELDVARIRVVQPTVGGAFGGKSEPFDLEFCVARLAQRTGRPVKILYTREEVFYSHRGRHPMRMKCRLGADAEGRIRAVDHDILLDGGAYASFGLVTAYYAGQLLTAPYTFGSYRFDSTRVYTNKPACGPKRGHGSVQPRFAFEIQLDKLARRLELDPIELRRRNFMGTGRTINELRVQSNGFLECLEAVESASEWKDRWGKLPRGHGLGVAGSTYISGTNYPIYPNDMPQSAIQMAIERSGRVTVWTGASEIGQGSDSVVAQIAAEELGVPLEYVRVVSTDTDQTPVDLGAYSSRETFMVGNAAVHAAKQLREKVVGAVADEWNVKPPRVGLAGGWAFDLRDTARRMPISEAFNLAEARHGTLGAVGHYNTPKDVHGEYRGGTIGASPAYSFTAHVAEVEVDEETGYVAVKNILGRPRLRPGPQSRPGGGPDGRVRVHGLRRGDLRGAGLQERPGREGRAAQRPIAPRLPTPHLPRHPRPPLAHHRECGPRGPVWRQGGRRRPAAPVHSRHCQRHLRRRRRPPRLAPLLSLPRLARPPRRRGRRSPGRRRTPRHHPAPRSR